MDLNCRMPVFGQSGVELLCRNIVISLDKLGVKIALDPFGEWNYEHCILPQEDKERLTRMCQHRVSEKSPYIFFRESVNIPKEASKKICITLFETDKCPRPWIKPLNEMDEVWVFSEFNRMHWIQSGIAGGKLHVMPFGVDTKLFSPSAKPMQVTNRKKFMFLTNGDYTERKNFEALIEAFVKEFKKEDDVCLVIKAHYGGFTRKFEKQCAERLREAVKNFGNDKSAPVLFFGKKMAAEDMASLYTAADCFVLPTRGEGLGLCVAEAMASGISVIATGWSAYTDFLNQDNGFPVEYTLETIDDSEFIRKCLIALNHKWAQISIDKLRDTMRFVYEFPAEAKKKTAVALEEMQKRDWQSVGLWILKRLISGK